MLYASARNCALIRSAIRKSLNIDTSQLFVPGPRKTSLGALPQVPCGPKPNALVLNAWLKSRWSFGSTGFAITVGLAPSVGEPDQLLALKVDVKDRLTPVGAPLWNVVMPEICQPSSTARFSGVKPRPSGR